MILVDTSVWIDHFRHGERDIGRRKASDAAQLQSHSTIGSISKPAVPAGFRIWVNDRSTAGRRAPSGARCVGDLIWTPRSARRLCAGEYPRKVLLEALLDRAARQPLVTSGEAAGFDEALQSRRQDIGWQGRKLIAGFDHGDIGHIAPPTKGLSRISHA